jgi:hypothetical protein
MLSWLYFALTVWFVANTCSLDTPEAVIGPQTMIFGETWTFECVDATEFFYSESLAAGSLDQLPAPLERIPADA